MIFQTEIPEKLNLPGFAGGSKSGSEGSLHEQIQSSPEIRERAVRMVQEHPGEHPSADSPKRPPAGRRGDGYGNGLTEAIKGCVKNRIGL